MGFSDNRNPQQKLGSVVVADVAPMLLLIHKNHILRLAAGAAIKSYQMVWRIWFGEIPPGYRILYRSGDRAVYTGYTGLSLAVYTGPEEQAQGL